MTKRKLYIVISIALVFGVYGYEYFLVEKDKEVLVSDGQKVKNTTNEFYLPLSTTGQIVHHNGYSLSYSEPHEQAEWVAYELKKSHLSSINHKRPYFEVDTAVETGAAHWRNYKKSGFDRGHLCPNCTQRSQSQEQPSPFCMQILEPG